MVRMKVKEIVKELQKLDQEMELVFYSSEEGNVYKVPTEDVVLEKEVDYCDEEDFAGPYKYILYVG